MSGKIQKQFPNKNKQTKKKWRGWHFLMFKVRKKNEAEKAQNKKSKYISKQLELNPSIQVKIRLKNNPDMFFS